jgi:hypothetical protein
VRTTIELDEPSRGRLLELAARRGKKGFTDLVNEAVVRDLDAHDAVAERQRAAARLHGALSADEADALVDGVAAARAIWRASDGEGR